MQKERAKSVVDSKQAARLKRIRSRVVAANKTTHGNTAYIMVWGPIKTGKTTFTASGEKPCIFLTEPGHMTIRRLTRVQVFPIDDRGDWVPPTWHDAYDYLFYLRHANHDFKTAGVDSLSGLVTIAMRFILKDEEARDVEREPGTPDKRTWGRLNTIVLEYIEELETVCKTRGMSLVLTAHERQPREDDMEDADVVPDLTPGIRRAILKRPDIIARTFTEESEDDEEVLAYGMTFRDPEYMVGERVTPVGAKKPWLPRNAYNVTLPKLIRRIERSSSGSKN